MNPYSSIVCDEFGVYAYTNTKMELPLNRHSILSYFSSLKKMFPRMGEFDCRDSGEYVLEEDRESGSYRWVALEPRRFCAGYVNPPSLADAHAFHHKVLEVTPYHFDFSPLDCDAFDVVFGFDLIYGGNHDEVVAEALGVHPALEGLLIPGERRVLNFQPSITIALDESCRLQCRLNIETRTNPYQVRTGQFSEVPISVYFTVRQYWEGQPYEKLAEAYQKQQAICQDVVDKNVVPRVVQPLAQTISTK